MSIKTKRVGKADKIALAVNFIENHFLGDYQRIADPKTCATCLLYDYADYLYYEQLKENQNFQDKFVEFVFYYACYITEEEARQELVKAGYPSTNKKGEKWSDEDVARLYAYIVYWYILNNSLVETYNVLENRYNNARYFYGSQEAFDTKDNSIKKALQEGRKEWRNKATLGADNF